MKPLSFAAALLFLTGAVGAQTLGPVDWIFLVDTSKSMRGIGAGSKGIWDDVRASLASFVHEAGERDTVTMYAFDADVRKVEADDLYRAIITLPAEGKRTH
ncbi:MAG TPA: VWA domain-containing protein, partial [Thermoanaerobaculia bacterium]|nr:VWA domain-containing protein [Thermoanaerobaculia bacterium]